jgi:hypothetical protein
MSESPMMRADVALLPRRERSVSSILYIVLKWSGRSATLDLPLHDRNDRTGLRIQPVDATV